MTHEFRTIMKQPEFCGLVGVARKDITPPQGIYSRSWGSAKHDVADGVHRPFVGTCLVFKNLNGTTELILLALDAVIFWQEEAMRIRKTIIKHMGLQPEQLVLHPSHTHSGPMLSRGHAARPGGHLIEPYLDSIPAICCDLITEARTSVRESTVSWTYGKCALAFNRDSEDPTTHTSVCGINLEEIADDTVLVGRVTDTDGKIRAVVVNYACHPVSLGGGNRLLSPDYPGAMRDVVEKETDGAICVFLHGASGDLTPRRSYEADVEAADQNGKELGYAVLSALNSMLPPRQQLQYKGIQKSGAILGVWDHNDKPSVSSEISAQVVTMQLPLKDLPSCQEIEEKIQTCTERYRLERLERDLIMRNVVGDGKEGSIYFTVWRLGDFYLVATPTEAYSQFQIAIRNKLPDSAIAILNASDGYLGYLPEFSDYERDLYQVGFAIYDQGSLEHIIDKALNTIQEMAKLPTYEGWP